MSERMTAERAARLLRAVAAERRRTGATQEQTAPYLAAAEDYERRSAARPTRSTS